MDVSKSHFGAPGALGLSPSDREIWQQQSPAQNLATRAGKTGGFAKQGTLGKGLAEEFVAVSVTALPN